MMSNHSQTNFCANRSANNNLNPRNSQHNASKKSSHQGVLREAGGWANQYMTLIQFNIPIYDRLYVSTQRTLCSQISHFDVVFLHFNLCHFHIFLYVIVTHVGEGQICIGDELLDAQRPFPVNPVGV